MIKKTAAFSLILAWLFLLSACNYSTIKTNKNLDDQGGFQAGEVFRDCEQCPVLVVIPSGAFIMGSDEGDKDEKPAHEVLIEKSFAIGKYEVSQREWLQHMEVNRSRFQGSDNPVEKVSFDDIEFYLAKLTQLTGQKYRLPTEAEWEYAARAGTTTEFHTGITISSNEANYNANYTINGGVRGLYRKSTTAVGSFPPNQFGLHDMHGNVWEWTEDCYKPDYIKASRVGRAFNPKPCTHRVVRGGAWYFPPKVLRSASRSWSAPTDRIETIGFRVVREL